jgi:hypothetical protein
MGNEFQFVIPNRAWFTLREACELKNLNYKTSCNRTYLQPNRGKPDGHIGGKKVYSRETIAKWLLVTDEVVSQ